MEMAGQGSRESEGTDLGQNNGIETVYSESGVSLRWFLFLRVED